jgi:hypothetical protein
LPRGVYLKKQKLLITIPVALKRAVEKAAEYRGCSQAEIVRTALYEHLKSFVTDLDREQRKQGRREVRDILDL